MSGEIERALFEGDSREGQEALQTRTNTNHAVPGWLARREKELAERLKSLIDVLSEDEPDCPEPPV